MESNLSSISMINSDTGEVTKLGSVAYLFNKESFIPVCADGVVQIAEYFIQNLNGLGQTDLIEGFRTALEEKHVGLCELILKAIPDLTINKFSLFKTVSCAGHVNLLKKLFELLPEDNVDLQTKAAKKSFKMAAKCYRINVLEFLSDEGYFFDKAGKDLLSNKEESVLKKLVEEFKYSDYFAEPIVRSAHLGRTEVEKNSNPKDGFIKTYKWLEDHGATLDLSSAQLFLISDSCCKDRDIFWLVFTSIKKSNSDKVIADFLHKTVEEIVETNNKTFMKELIEQGIKPNHFVRDWVYSMRGKNFDLIYDLIDLGAEFKEQQLEDILMRTIEKFPEHFFILVNRLHLDLKTYSSTIYLVSKALESCSVDFNRALHEMVNYLNQDIKFCEKLARNKNMRSVIKWFNEIGINPTQDDFISGLSTASIYSNSDYVLYCLEQNYATPDQVREAFKSVSFGSKTSFGAEAIIAQFNSNSN